LPYVNDPISRAAEVRVTTDQLVPDEGTGDYRDPALRLSRLLDANSPVPLHESDDGGVLAMKDRIDGVDVLAYSTDARVMGGSMAARGCRRIVEAIDTAARESSPVIGLWHYGGARLAEGPEALEMIAPADTRRRLAEAFAAAAARSAEVTEHPTVNWTEER
jgi:acetyl-CoA carboxylase carboxyltransferase component